MFITNLWPSQPVIQFTKRVYNCSTWDPKKTNEEWVRSQTLLITKPRLNSFSNLSHLYLCEHNPARLDKESLNQFIHQLSDSMPEKIHFLFHQSLFSFIGCTENRKYLLTSAIWVPPYVPTVQSAVILHKKEKCTFCRVSLAVRWSTKQRVTLMCNQLHRKKHSGTKKMLTWNRELLVIWLLKWLVDTVTGSHQIIRSPLSRLCFQSLGPSVSLNTKAAQLNLKNYSFKLWARLQLTQRPPWSGLWYCTGITGAYLAPVPFHDVTHQHQHGYGVASQPWTVCRPRRFFPVTTRGIAMKKTKTHFSHRQQ